MSCHPPPIFKFCFFKDTCKTITSTVCKYHLIKVGDQCGSLVAHCISIPGDHDSNPGGGKFFPLMYLSYNLMIAVYLELTLLYNFITINLNTEKSSPLPGFEHTTAVVTNRCATNRAIQA